jgi:colicin import membrane protein
MPRTGVSEDQVAAIADAIVAEGNRPTLAAVRLRLGTGGGNTIHRHFCKWRLNRPGKPAVAAQMPAAIVEAFNLELERVAAQARADSEDRLVETQMEAAELAEIGEALEVELEEVSAVCSGIVLQRDALLKELEEKNLKIDNLTKELERERYSVELARTELAQVRNKVEILTLSVAELTKSAVELKDNHVVEVSARIAAEKEAAVLVARLEAEQEKTALLRSEQEALLGEVRDERTARLKADKRLVLLKNKFKKQSVIAATGTG